MISIAIAGADGGHSIGDWAALAGVIIATLSAGIAIHTYRGSLRESSRAHMHSVFRDYLRLCIECPDGPKEDLDAYRFYALEEVFIWARTERGRWWFDRMGASDHKSWMATIDFHILDADDPLDYFDGKWGIFDEGFVAHVQNLLGYQPPAAAPPLLPDAPPEQPAA